MNTRLTAHRHPLTQEDCDLLRRIALPAVVIGSTLLLMLTVRAIIAFESALAAASGV